MTSPHLEGAFDTPRAEALERAIDARLGEGVPAVSTDHINNTKIIRPADWAGLEAAIQNNNTAGQWDNLWIPWGHDVVGPGRTITISPTDPDGGPRQLRLYAPGTVLEATDTPANNEWLFDIPANSGDDARIDLVFSQLKGALPYPDAWSGIRGTDVTNVSIGFRSMSLLYQGIEVRNVNSYSEEWTIEGDMISASKAPVAFNRDGGDASFQGLELRTRLNMFGGSYDKYGIWMPNGRASFSESTIVSKIFVTDPEEYAVGAYLTGGDWYINCDVKDEGDTAIRLLGPCNDPASFVLETNGNIGTVCDVQGGIAGFNFDRKTGSKIEHYYANTKTGSRGRYPEITQRSNLPQTGELAKAIEDGAGSIVVSDGSTLPGSQGDLIYFYNDGGSIKSLNLGTPT